ncbi:hypothetical protein A0H81_04377 [Grifola frondosa]|uniref:Uncharacterized protein n=1 Tax=Grifola frondosa TaxID=5627 RepID=A0A1C7MEQ0_GRIFR|nr:hypothetical protein A0H81_04377 [Grifola frondosa]
MQSTFVCLAALFAHVQHACAQTVVNGQIFTNGLAIIDAPASNSSLHAGSTIQVAIDVSGDGKLSQSASIPGSSQSTRFDSLETYLVSYQKSQNLTVSSGPGLLTRESGSTVKHWNYNVSTCVPAGSYNLTFYEGSRIDGQAYFSITPVPVEVMNDNPSGACSEGMNTLQDYPQRSSSPPSSPWLSSTASGSSVFPSSTGANSSPTSM